MRSTEKVIRLWDEVWNAHDLDAVDKFFADDVVLVTGRQECTGKENLKKWIKGFVDKVNDLEVGRCGGIPESGLFGIQLNGEEIALSGIAVFAVDDEGKFERLSVEQDSFEQYRQLPARPTRRAQRRR
jgi:SnoaL-like domain